MTVVIGLTLDLSLPGWFVSILVAVVFLATGSIATTPSPLVRLSEVLPVGPASEGLRDVPGGSGSARRSPHR